VSQLDVCTPAREGRAAWAARGRLLMGAVGAAAAAAVIWSPPGLATGVHLEAPRPARVALTASAFALALVVALAPRPRRRRLVGQAGVALGVLAVVTAAPDLEASAALLVLLAGLSAASAEAGSFADRLRRPALGALLIGLGALLAHSAAAPLTRAGVVAVALGLAAAAGLLPYQQRLEEDDAAGSDLVWPGLFGPALALAISARLGPALGREQGVYQEAMVALGLVNLIWGVVGAWRAPTDAAAWRCSFLADWGLALVGLGLPGAGRAAAYLLLLSVVTVRLPMYLCARPVLTQCEPRRGGALAVVGAAALAGVAPFGGFPARALLLEAATRVAWPLALALAAAMLLWLLHAYRLGGSLSRSGPRTLVAAGVALAASLALGVLPGLWLGLGAL
jgi:hypothetical protein